MHPAVAGPQLVARPVDPSLQFARQSLSVAEHVLVTPPLPHPPQFLEKGARFFVQLHFAWPPTFGAVPV
jgi:hypothetical protein